MTNDTSNSGSSLVDTGTGRKPWVSAQITSPALNTISGRVSGPKVASNVE